MCLIAFAYHIHPAYPLVLIANRDELYRRETKHLHFWETEPNLLAGKDLEAGGTWMGIHKNGRFAALTNYRDPSNIRDDRKSRGELPVNFLTGKENPKQFLRKLDSMSDQYNGFNLIVGDRNEWFHYNNEYREIIKISPGIHGLSNAALNTPWPKVNRIKEKLEMAIQSEELTHENLLTLLDDNAVADDHELPATGVPYEWEKKLSAVRIATENYGTVSSTVLTINASGLVTFTEITLPVGGRKSLITTIKFK